MDKKNKTLILLMVLGVIMILLGSTFAYFSWRSGENKEVVFNTSKGLQEYIIYDSGESKFIGDFQVGSSYTSGVHTTVSIYKSDKISDKMLYATINMKVKEIGENLNNSEALKWTVTLGNATSNGKVLASGNFSLLSTGSEMAILPNFEVTTTLTEYTIWIWLDETLADSSMTGETADVSIWTQVDQIVVDKFEITKLTNNYQIIKATAVNSGKKIIGYQVTDSNTEPSTWISIPENEQNNIYNLEYTVNNTGTYYIWFKDKNNKIISKNLNVDKIDITGPVCTWDNISKNNLDEKETATISLLCTDSETGMVSKDLVVSDFTISNNIITISKVEKSNITNGYKYTLTVVGGNTSGETTITLPKDKLSDKVNNHNIETVSDNISVDAVKTYAITYKDVGGTEFSGVHGDNYPLTYTTKSITKLVNPSKTGYTFNGWYLAQDGSGTAITEIDGSTHSGELVLYAKWTVNTYTISYKDVGNTTFTGTHGNGYPIKYTYGKETTLVNPSKTGYTFSGWYLAQDGSGNAVTKISSTQTGNIVLYAKWSVNSYIVTYDYATNGGSEATKTSASVNYNANIDLTPTATKSNWTFVGWNTNKDATSGLSTLKMGTSNITLYAIYKKTITGTFNYYNNQNTKVSSTIYNKATTATITTPTIGNQTVSSVTYTARGWSTSNTGNANVAVTSGKTVTLSADQTYYASYQATITGTFFYSKLTKDDYIYKSGTQASVTTTAIRYMNYKGTYIQSNYTVPSTVTTSTGGASAENYIGVATAINSATIVTPSTANTKFYAVYTEPLTFYYYNGSSHVSKTVTRRMLSDGTSYNNSLSEAEVVPSSYDGASYVAWTYDSSNYSNDYRRVPLGTGTNALYAIYEKTFTVSYNANGGSGAPSNQTSKRTYVSKSGGINTYNQTITLSQTVPTRAGYTFNGWYNASSGGTKIGDKGASYTPTSSITLYANWTVNSYTVTYDYATNGGSGATKTSASVNYNANIDLTPTATKSGWTFVGWNTNKDATSGLSTLKMGTNNITLYAIYRKEAKTLTITFNKNGALTQTNSSGTAVSDTKITRTCTIAAVYNKATQATTCNVTSPTIVGSTNTPTVVGYNTSANSTSSVWNQNTAKTVSANATYYAITRANAITHTVTYKKGVNVSAIGATTGSCTRAATYNGTAQATSCNVTLPSITANAGYTSVGWNTTSGATTGFTGTRTLTGNQTLYANAFDKTAPTGSISLSLSDTVITAIVTASDSGSGIKNYGYLITTASSCPTSGYTTSANTTYNFTVSSSGTYYVCVKLTDKAGNESIISKQIIAEIKNITIDLPDGMIPIIFDTSNGTVIKTISSTDTSWYDYDNQEWANAVLVKESGTKTRDYYKSNIGVTINQADILAYYVYIPRYKYKIWSVDNDKKKGKEQTIEIEFETKDTEKSVGTQVGEYITHPAFTFGDTELSGIWVGKFETTGTASNPTILPDVTSLRNQNVSAQFATAQLLGGTNYGVTTNTDSHMMKNSEWGAVAYLSHSKYGANREIYINNSRSYYTGRSGGNVGGNTPINKTYTDQTSTTQYNNYGYYTWDGYLLEYNANTKSSTRDLSKVASTTGNITGIYDMSGGASDYVMGVFANSDGQLWSGYKTSYNSGFTGLLGSAGDQYTGVDFPDSKYYDVYKAYSGTSINSLTACNGGICYGHGLSEVNKWYNDAAYFVVDSFSWFTRGSNWSGGAGVFSFNRDDGSALNSLGFRSSLVVDGA